MLVSEGVMLTLPHHFPISARIAMCATDHQALQRKRTFVANCCRYATVAGAIRLRQQMA